MVPGSKSVGNCLDGGSGSLLLLLPGEEYKTARDLACGGTPTNVRPLLLCTTTENDAVGWIQQQRRRSDTSLHIIIIVRLLDVDDEGRDDEIRDRYPRWRCSSADGSETGPNLCTYSYPVHTTYQHSMTWTPAITNHYVY